MRLFHCHKYKFAITGIEIILKWSSFFSLNYTMVPFVILWSDTLLRGKNTYHHCKVGNKLYQLSETIKYTLCWWTQYLPLRLKLSVTYKYKLRILITNLYLLFYNALIVTYVLWNYDENASVRSQRQCQQYCDFYPAKIKLSNYNNLTIMLQNINFLYTIQ